MGKGASKTLIGVFVVGAMALIVAGVLVFGSGKFFKKTMKNVMFFEGSVKGLNVGAPVIFRGVNVGQVTDIHLHFNLKDLTLIIPVYIELDPSKAVIIGGELSSGKYLNALIEKGLRAQLQMQSFVTGQLIVNIDFYPDKPAKLVGIEKKYGEIPTIPAPLEELTQTIKDLKLDQVFKKLESAINGIDRIVNSPELAESIRSLNQALKSIDTLAKDISAQVKPLATDIRETSVAARSALGQAEKTLAMKEGVPGEIGAGLKEALAAARTTLEEVQKTVKEVRQIAAENANIGYELSRSLEQMAAMSRSLRLLADYLERHPEALIKGKSSSKGE